MRVRLCFIDLLLKWMNLLLLYEKSRRFNADILKWLVIPLLYSSKDAASKWMLASQPKNNLLATPLSCPTNKQLDSYEQRLEKGYVGGKG
jgi:hypothetical protein